MYKNLFFEFTGIAALFAAFCFAVVPAYSQNQPDGKIVEKIAYSFPPFEKAGDAQRFFSKQEYEEAIADAQFEMVKLKYSSDGLIVTAYLYKPRDTKNKKYPAIIFNRGGYIRGDIGAELAPFFRRLAMEGFVVLSPLYRASDGAEGKDEVGGADMNDLMNILPAAKSLDFIDPNNLFMYGESRGGMMTFQALRNNFPVNAAATFGGFTDFEALVNENPRVYQPLIKTIWTDYETKKDEINKTRSAVFWAEKINTPLLLMHGGADKSVNPLQTLNFAQLLQKAGKSYELVIYGGDNHILSRNQKDRDARTVAWFKKYLKQ
jgi:dipeptidyl aminopeptidase/acylaminoacyl peptidase